jgi:hypothetical protein
VAQSSSVGDKKVTVDLFGDLLGVFRMARVHDHLGALSRECARMARPMLWVEPVTSAIFSSSNISILQIVFEL